MSIPFTQYLLPDGKQDQVIIDRPSNIERKAHAFIAEGGKFDAEMLRTGEVSFTAEREGEVVAIEIAGNGPGVLAAVDRLVELAWERSVAL